MESQREKFYALLEEYISKHNTNKQDTVCLSQEKYEKALRALQLDKGEKCEDGAFFKFWCYKNFKVVNFGSKKVLHCKKSSCPVVTKEELFDTLVRCHERVGHSGRKKTWDEVHLNYSWIKHGTISLFLQTCTTCGVRRPLKPPPSGKPIISLWFLTRLTFLPVWSTQNTAVRQRA